APEALRQPDGHRQARARVLQQPRGAGGVRDDGLPQQQAEACALSMADAMGERDDDGLDPLLAGAAALGLPLDAAQRAQFALLRDLLLDWNTRVNLTAITDPGEVVTRHFLDALTCALALPAEARARQLRLLDVGSGA